ncbi:MAG: YihY/virulence factor BrkB family protein [Spirochaetota bacterium]
MDWIRAVLASAARVARRFSRDACAGRAAGLAFSTVFALVPLTAVVVALLTTLDVFEPVVEESQRALLEELVPAASDQVFESLAQFSENTRALGLFGFGLFVITAVALLRGIHTSLNAIWHFRSESGFWRRFSTYTTVLVLGTALLAAAVVAGPTVRSMVNDSGAVPGWFGTLSQTLLPPLLLFGTLFLMITLVPSGRVSSASAAVGAIVGVLGWEVAKRVFVFWAGSVMRLSLIYGSLAAVPIFLIWIYITWMIVLAGVEVAYVHQHRNEPVDDRGSDQPAAPLGELSDYAVRALASVIVRFRDGLAPLTQHDLDERYGAATAEAISDGLVGSGLVLETNRGFVPSRDLSAISVEDVVAGLLAGTGGDPAARALLSAWKDAPERPVVTVFEDYFRNSSTTGTSTPGF